jgi:hypothetical protein
MHNFFDLKSLLKQNSIFSHALSRHYTKTQVTGSPGRSDCPPISVQILDKNAGQLAG